MAFPQSKLPIRVSVALDADPTADPGTWSFTDITNPTPQYVKPNVTITRGRSGEQTEAGASSSEFEIKNPGGVWSPRNPTGPKFGRFGKNTPMRVEVDGGSGYVTRHTGHAFWPQKWSGPGIDERVSMRADGMLRRLEQGKAPVRSPLYRSTSAALVAGQLAAYWPLEAGPGSAVAGVPALDVVGEVTFGVDSGCPGSAPLPDDLIASGGSFVGPLLSTGADADDAWQYEAVLKWNTSGQLLRLDLIGAPFWDYLEVVWDTTPTPDELRINLWDADLGTATIQIIAQADDFDLSVNVCHHVAVRVTTSIGTTTLRCWVDGILVGTASASDNFTGIPRRPRINKNGPVTVGHITLYSPLTTAPGVVAFMDEAAAGYVGERAGARFSRLCLEEGIAADVRGSDTPGYAMGVQSTSSLMTLLSECEAACEGLIVERMTGKLGLDLTTYRENRPVDMVLDYAQKHIMDLDHTDDDRYTRNDWTVTTPTGLAGQVVDADGPLGVNNVGRYDDGGGVNLDPNNPDLPVHHAGWRVNTGTVDAPRFPKVTVSLTANPQLISKWLACDIGSRIQLKNLPDYVLFDDLDVVLEGYTEYLDSVDWRVDLVFAPYEPYIVAVLAEADLKLLTAEDTTATSWRVGAEMPFTNSTDRPGDFPIRLSSDGEVVYATAAAKVSPSLAVGTAAHADNASVQGTHPSHAEGDLLIQLAAIRSSGTGTVDLPAGWTNLRNFGNMRVIAKYAASAAEPNPTITFTGGAAGDSCSVLPLRYRGLQIDVVNFKEQLNGSAQDIAYPHYVQEGDYQVLQFCWKQDDYTSVAPGAGLTEVAEAFTLLGNDQSLYVARLLDTVDAVPVAAGSNVVTGGAAAISRVIWLTLRRGVSDLTVQRSINGVAVSHAQLADVDVDQPMNLGL